MFRILLFGFLCATLGVRSPLLGADLMAIVTDASKGSTIEFINTPSGAQADAIAVQATLQSAAVYTPNGRLAAVNVAGTLGPVELEILDLPSGKPAGSITLKTIIDVVLAPSPNNTVMFAIGGPNSSNNVIYRLDLTTFTSEAVFKSNANLSALAVSPNGKSLYAAQSNAVLSISTSDYKVQTTYEISNALSTYQVVPSPDGKRLYVSDSNSFPLANSLVAINVASGAVVGSITTNTLYNDPGFAVVSPDSSKVYMTSEGADAVLEISAATFTLTGTLPLPLYIYNQSPLAISPDGNTLAVTTNASTSENFGTDVTLVATPGLTAGVAVPVGNVCGVSFTPQAKVAVTNCQNNTLQTVDLVTQKVTSWFDAGPTPQNALVTPDGATIFSYNQTGVWAIAASTGKVLSKLEKNPTLVSAPLGTSMALSADGSKLFAVTMNGVEVISTSNHQVTGLVPNLPDGFLATAVATSPNGAYLFVGGGAQLFILDEANYTVVSDVSLGEGSVYWIFVSPDGSQVYTVVNYLAEFNTVSAYSIPQGADLGGETQISSSPVSGASLSPDGTELYFVDENTIYAFNTSTFTESVVESPVEPYGVAVTPRGTGLIVTSVGTSMGVVDLANTTNSYSFPLGATTGGISLF